jgi:hypothetical protein
MEIAKNILIMTKLEVPKYVLSFLFHWIDNLFEDVNTIAVLHKEEAVAWYKVWLYLASNRKSRLMERLKERF